MRFIRLSAHIRFLLLGASLMLCSPQPATAQKKILRAEYISIDDGLSDRLINDIIQDRQGFLWLATPNGLNRFDGYEFLHYNNHPDNEFAISGTNTERLALDENGNLIIFYTNNKVFFDILDPRTNALKKVRLSLEDGIKGFVRTIHVNRYGQIYLLSVHEDGTHVYRCHPFAEAHLELLFRIPEVHSSVMPSIDMVQLDDGAFLINDSELGLRLFSPNGALHKAFNAEDFECLDKIPNYPIPANFLHQDGNGRIWLSLQKVKGVFRFNPERKFFEQMIELPSDDNFTRIWEDHKGNVLLAQSDFTNSFSLEVSQLHCIRPDGSIVDFDYLVDINPRILSVYADDFFKTVFLGMETGLGIIENNRSKVQTFLAQDINENVLGNLMRGIDGDGKGTVYFANEQKEWYRLDLITNYLDTLEMIDENTGEAVFLHDCIDIQLDSSGNIWGISRSENGQGLLHKYSTEWCTMRTYSFPYEFSAFTLSRDGRIWLLCQPQNEKGCLVSFDTSALKFKMYRDRESQNPLKNSVPYYILEGKENLLWIGTDNGLFAIDRETSDSRNFRIQPDNSVGLSSNTIYVIHQDPAGKLWLGTNNGLNILDPDTKEVRTLDKRNGLASNIVCGILPDANGNYWISTYYGLSFYEPQKNQFRNFYGEDGFSHDEFNRFSFFRDEKGRFYFGGVNGMNAFYPEELLINDPPPPLLLTRLTRYNSRKDSLISQCTPLCEIEEVVISPYDIYFQLHFMLPNFSNPHKNQFKAWLVGYENDWIYLGNTPNIRYSKLPAGAYTLLLNGSDPNGNWSPRPLSIKIRVKPIFYKTWWFILIVSLLGIGAIYALFRYRLEQRLKVERLRTKLSSDLHDEVSGLLSGIAMQTDVLQEIVQDQNSKNKLKTIGDKSRKAMSKMSDVIWSIDSRNDRVEDLVHRMHEHAEEMLAPLSIEYQFHISRLDRQVKIPVKIRQELYFIFKEAINNIVKHAFATSVDIHLVNNGAQFEMRVHDNGRGKPKVNGKSGQGLANIRMRAQRINANLDIMNGDGYTVLLKMKKFA